MIERFILDNEYSKLAKKYNLTERQVKEIFESQFIFTREAMREGIKDNADSFKNINYIKLGKLYVKKGVINKYVKLKQIKKEKEDEQKNS